LKNGPLKLFTHLLACLSVILQFSAPAYARAYWINTSGEPVDRPMLKPLPGWKFKNTNTWNEKELAWQIAPNGQIYRLAERNWTKNTEDRFLIEKDGRYGYVDLKGDLVIPAIFEQALNFSGGISLAKVPGDSRYAEIDTSGKINDYLPTNLMPVQPEFYGYSGYVFMWSGLCGNGLIEVWVSNKSEVDGEKKTGIYNLKKRRLMPLPPSAALGKFSDGLATISSFRNSNDGLSSKINGIGFINQDGELAVPIKYDQTFQFGDGLCPVRLGKRWFFIDNTGREAITLPQNCLRAASFKDGRAAIELGNQDAASTTPSTNQRWIYHPSCMIHKHRWAFIDTSGKIVIPGKLTLSHPTGPSFSDGLLPARSGTLPSCPVGFVDRDGRWAIPAQFKGAYSFVDGIAQVWIPDEAFSQENWNKKIARGPEFEQFLLQNKLIGMDRLALIYLLGEPDSSAAERDRITYDFWATETHSLGVEITLHDDKVVSYKYVHPAAAKTAMGDNVADFEWY
jgi:WG containing repeat